MSTIKERIKMFCERKNLKVVHFENNCGMTNGYVNAIRRSISEEKLAAIKKAYPELNPNWLMFNEGYMLTTDTPEVVERERQNGIYDRLTLFISTYLEISFNDFEEKCGLPKDFIINRKPVTDDILDRIALLYPNLSKKWLNIGLGEMLMDEYVTIYDRIKHQFKIHKIDFGYWERNVLKYAQGTLSRMKNSIPEIKLDYIAEKLPPEVDRKWILEGRRELKNTAQEPMIPYVVSLYAQQEKQVDIETPEVHEIEEGTKAIVIPINLSRNPKMKFSQLSAQKIDVGKIMKKFSFMYQVQTSQLESFLIYEGDWLMLAPLGIGEVINGEIYMINSDTYGCMVRAFYMIDADRCKLVNLEEPYDEIETPTKDINDILDIVGIFKNVTSMLPFSKTLMGKTILQKDKMISDAMTYNKEMFEELRKSGKRTDLLIDILINKIK